MSISGNDATCLFRSMDVPSFLKIATFWDDFKLPEISKTCRKNVVSMTARCHGKKKDMGFNIPIGNTSIPLTPSIAPCEARWNKCNSGRFWSAHMVQQENPWFLYTFCSRGAQTIVILWFPYRRTFSGKKTISFCVRCVAEALKPVQFMVFLIGGHVSAREPIVFVYVL